MLIIKEELMGIIAIISIFALPLITALILIFKKLNSTHKERMGLIQQGIIPPNQTKRKSTPNRYRSLRNGVILVALGFGIIVGIIGTETLQFAENEPFLFAAASAIFFLGLGYLAFFLITKNSKSNDDANADNDIEEDFE